MDYIKYQFRNITCFLFGHTLVLTKWYKQCVGCGKIEDFKKIADKYKEKI